MGVCASCGEPLDEHAAACSACGSAVADATASFAPVGDLEQGSEVPGGTEGPVLVVRKGPQPGERFHIDRARLTIGRDPESDIFLNDMTVSRAHAVLSKEGDVVTVRDAGSLNGTYVNGLYVETAPLRDGDVVQIGTFQMVYFGETAGR